MVVLVSLSSLRFFFLFLFIIIPFATSLSFNFDRFDPNDKNIRYELDSSSANGAIQVTANQLDRPTTNGGNGRATYLRPLHLWDNATGNVTDFTTHFSFSINSLGNTSYADGFAFFLAPALNGTHTWNDSEEMSGGYSLGLLTFAPGQKIATNRFVAVEFDTFQSWDDPPGDHVGIDISSIRSAVTVNWSSSIPDGKKTDAWISYNSSSKNLSVIFTGYQRQGNTTTVPFLQSLSYILDMREHLPEWVIVGFTGTTGKFFELQSIFSWNFTSTLDSNDTIPLLPNITVPKNPNHTDQGATPPEPGHAPSKNKLGLVVGLVSGGFVFVAVCILILFACWKKRKAREKKVDISYGSMTNEFERSKGPKKFRYRKLSRCTNNFAREAKLGEGGFGDVYKGYVRELNSYIAVKRVSRESKQGIKEYASEVMIISRLRHRNLVQLIGWCHEKRQLLLVYEFMPNGSLDSHLFKGKSHLTWPIRYKIAQGLASGLLYLHEEWEKCVLHRDIKPSNIMLDSDFNAKLGDFGLARLVDHGKGSQTTDLAGTVGYIAPESVTTGKASKETDVYSFGIVALEIGCGRKPIDTNLEEDRVNIVDWVWSLYGTQNLREAADPKLSSEFDEQEMERLLIVGLWCAHPDSNCRPSIRQAIQVLNFEAPLPILPLNMPVLTYCSPSQYLPTDSLPSTPCPDSLNNTTTSAATLSTTSLNYPR